MSLTICKYEILDLLYCYKSGCMYHMSLNMSWIPLDTVPACVCFNAVSDL